MGVRSKKSTQECPNVENVEPNCLLLLLIVWAWLLSRQLSVGRLPSFPLPFSTSFVHELPFPLQICHSTCVMMVTKFLGQLRPEYKTRLVRTQVYYHSEQITCQIGNSHTESHLWIPLALPYAFVPTFVEAWQSHNDLHCPLQWCPMDIYGLELFGLLCHIPFHYRQRQREYATRLRGAHQL